MWLLLETSILREIVDSNKSGERKSHKPGFAVCYAWDRRILGISQGVEGHVAAACKSLDSINIYGLLLFSSSFFNCT